VTLVKLFVLAFLSIGLISCSKFKSADYSSRSLSSDAGANINAALFGGDTDGDGFLSCEERVVRFPDEEFDCDEEDARPVPAPAEPPTTVSPQAPDFLELKVTNEQGTHNNGCEISPGSIGCKMVVTLTYADLLPGQSIGLDRVNTNLMYFDEPVSGCNNSISGNIDAHTFAGTLSEVRIRARVFNRPNCLGESLTVALEYPTAVCPEDHFSLNGFCVANSDVPPTPSIPNVTISTNASAYNWFDWIYVQVYGEQNIVEGCIEVSGSQFHCDPLNEVNNYIPFIENTNDWAYQNDRYELISYNDIAGSGLWIPGNYVLYARNGEEGPVTTHEFTICQIGETAVGSRCELSSVVNPQ
jgi:hypothetical protein